MSAEASWTRLVEAVGRQTGARRELVQRLVGILRQPTGVSTAGYPYLQRRAWRQFRDTVPHLFGGGLQLYRIVEAIEESLSETALGPQECENIEKACGVARQVVKTATITAPPDLWLIRHVLGYFDELGLTRRLLSGEAIYPAACRVDVGGETVRLAPEELERDLHFLLARGLVEQYDDSFRIAGHPRVGRLFRDLEPIAEEVPTPMTPVWRRLFRADIAEGDRRAIERLGEDTLPAESTDRRHNHWIPTHRQLSVGYRLLPIVLALRAEGSTDGLVRGSEIEASAWNSEEEGLVERALEVLTAARWLEASGSGHRVSAIGARGFARGPGPFGIIETYHAYLANGGELLTGRAGELHVERSENVGASQTANRKTFRQANDALDRFCREAGFEFSLFVEHAIGRGEATRQRYERSGDEGIDYVGADLEDAAIDAAERQKERGELPAGMIFVRDADIGDPEVLLGALRDKDLDPHGAVMMVGNGFHEVREADRERMVEIFERYHEAGLVLLFTEANALSIDDLRATAWNTYHAGFTYLHEKSGQALRPAHPRPKPRLGRPLRASWSECARRAGYVRAAEFCDRSRTIYPYTPEDGHNPSISENHFFVPADIADTLEW